ncbi:MAG: bifunctional folylpolyglutamate synthase/dihydrofolate synthase [bacterium]
MITMQPEEAISYIHSFHAPRGSRTLRDTRALLAALGSPEEALRFIHIAGTNGKGSTAAMLESILRAAGYKTGLFTSPYIERFQERIRIDGEDIGDALLTSLVEEVRPLAEKHRPTEFELVTVLALLAFRRCGCAWVVLEAGLGGKDDFTNVIPAPALAVITRLGLDHTERLGPTLRDIAAHKAGILKPGARCVTYEENAVLSDTARALGVPLAVAPKDLPFPVELPLLGDFQRRNAAVAITAARLLEIPDETIRRGLEAVRWRGRFELLREDPVFLLDGGHNPQAIREVMGEFQRRYGSRPRAVVTGIMADKAVEEVIEALRQPGVRYFAVPIAYPRALPAETYAAKLRAAGLPAEYAPSIEAGVRAAAEAAGQGGAVLALGSLYFSQEIRNAAHLL